MYRSVFTENAHIDYSSAGAPAGPRDEVAEWLAQGFAAIPMSMHYITNVEILGLQADVATVRAMFYNPMTLPGMSDLSYCGGYYHHELVRTADGLLELQPARSKRLVRQPTNGLLSAAATASRGIVFGGLGRSEPHTRGRK